MGRKTLKNYMATQFPVRNQIRLFGFCIITVIFASCHKTTGEGPVITEDRSVKVFSGIAMDAPGVLQFIQDSTYSVQIKAQANVQRLIESTIAEGQLRIGLKRNTHLGAHKMIEITVRAPGISRVEVNGSAEAFIPATLNAKALTLSVAGSGNIYCDSLIVGQAFSAVISGSGNMVLSFLESDQSDFNISGSGNVMVHGGKTNDGRITISGSGKLDLFSLPAKNITVHSSGSGDAQLSVSDHLEVNISGSGDIYYKGNPKITTDITGSGKVVPQ